MSRRVAQITSSVQEDGVFVAALKKEQCLLPTAVASVGLSLHTCMQTATKGRGWDTHVKDILRVTPVAEAQAGETRRSTAHCRALRQKPWQVRRKVTGADVYIQYVQQGGRWWLQCSGP